MSNINEVKDDLTEDDLKSFEEAEAKGEVKTGGEEEESKEETEESEEEETETEEEESEEEEVTVKSSKTDVEVKEVAGETPREKALRLEVTRLRREKREALQGNIFKNGKQEVEEEDDDSVEELKKLGYDDDQIKTLDKAFDIIGKQKGFVNKSQSYEKMANNTLDQFIEEHPEYSAENDKDDLYWNRFNSILKSDYNLTGKSDKQLKSIFEKVNRDVKDELGEVTKKNDDRKIDAQKQKVSSVSAGASGASITTSKSTVAKPVVSGGNKTFISSAHPGLTFKGFDEDEVEEFTN